MPQAMGGRCTMGFQSGHCHPDVPGEVGVAQVRPQRPEGGLHIATQSIESSRSGMGAVEMGPKKVDVRRGKRTTAVHESTLTGV